jgi:hypothetical protein
MQGGISVLKENCQSAQIHLAVMTVKSMPAIKTLYLLLLILFSAFYFPTGAVQ